MTADLVALVTDAISQNRWREPGVSDRELAATAVLAIARSDDWHIISSAKVTREDDPPIPDHRVEEASRYGMREPQRVTTVKVELDGEVITARGTLSRYVLATAHASGYMEHADRALGLDFLQLVGHRLGVPGCEDVPERLAKAGHP